MEQQRKQMLQRCRAVAVFRPAQRPRFQRFSLEDPGKRPLCAGFFPCFSLGFGPFLDPGGAVRGLLHRVRQRLARKRLCTLRGRLRGAVHLLRGYLWARRRRRAAVEVQRHVRTFLQRETLKALARQRGQRHAAREPSG